MPTGRTKGAVKAASEQASTNLWSEYQIEAKTSLTGKVLRSLKYGDAFAVMDSYGDFGTAADTAEGLYYRDTRYLSSLTLLLEGRRPLQLSSAVHEDKAALSVELTNPDIHLQNHSKLERDTIFVQRTKFLFETHCYERIALKSFARIEQRLKIDLFYDADFSDLFEVRGTRRPLRGQTTSHVKAQSAIFTYTGRDAVERRTTIEIEPRPMAIDVGRSTVEVVLKPSGRATIFVTVSCNEAGVPEVPRRGFFSAYRALRRERRAATADIATVAGSNASFNDIICRATADVYTLVSATERGPYPYAGIPWFNTIFGRDGIITAMLMLWVDASVARGVLRNLAATQADFSDPRADAQPGKIIHEMRRGEMAGLGEVPFARYYGSIDATPLFVMLAGMYLERTGDIATIREIWPNITAALGWIDEFGDLDGDGLTEYLRAEATGLANQGWKDSHDAIFHADGTCASGPIALCEVQGYVFAAKTHASKLATRLGLAELSKRLAMEAEALKDKFERAFWCEELGSYALALDGAKRQCRVLASNAGHALFSGIASPERARRVVSNLLSPEAYSGWGIRTLAMGQARYNPLSYHNGSVWPHDNAMIAMGFSRYGFRSAAARVLSGIVEAARYQDMFRLPELFCGFNRHPHRAPTPYPVACAPQAWAAASVFGLLGATLGLELSFRGNEIRFRDPLLPGFLDELVIRNLKLGDTRTDIRVHRHGHDVTASVLARRGATRVSILK